MTHLPKKYEYFVCLTALNFMIFGIGVSILGGDAIGGKIENGHYFLTYRTALTEVSRAVFMYSRYQAYSVFAMFAGVFIYPIYYGFSKKK